jgi:hypothetical protein
VADFDRSSRAGYVLFKPANDQTVIGFLSGPSLRPGWTLVGAADFSGDGKADYLLYNVNTQQRGLYYLNNKAESKRAKRRVVCLPSL